MGWVYNSSDNYPTNENFIPLPEKDMVQPYPTSLWRIIGDRVYHLLYPSLPEKSMISPYPKALWRIEQEENNELPFHELLPYVPPLGAGCHALNLRSIIIPNTTNSIGKNSFTFSRIRSVKLPTNCTYYSTSFPENCNVTGGIRLD